MVAARSVLVVVSISVTVAPGTTALDGSVTTPTRVPVAANCAPLGRTQTVQTTNSASERTNLLERIDASEKKRKIFSPQALRETRKLSQN